MSDYFKYKKAIGKHLPISDIMDNKISLTVSGLLVYYNTYMRQSSPEIPAHNITGNIITGIPAYWFFNTLSPKECHQIGHASMVNVGVRFA
jgi:hypothetical protein